MPHKTEKSTSVAAGRKPRPSRAAAAGRTSPTAGASSEEVENTRKKRGGAGETDDKKSRDRRRRKAADTSQLSFAYYITEGNTYQTSGNYKRAIVGYTKALEQNPDHRHCLLSRSNCYLQVGDTAAALQDANSLLTQDSKYIKGVQQKADVLYQMGEFEQALVLYHRGNKLRPDIDTFRLGIQLCQDAIDNSIGDKAGIKLEKIGDLSFFTELQQSKESSDKRKRAVIVREASKMETVKRDRKNRKLETDERTMKQLLEELYTDKEYLEALLSETERVNSNSQTSEEVIHLSSSCLDYLDTRATFWQQKEPTYSRERSRQLQASTKSKSGRSSVADADPTTWILDNLQRVDEDQTSGRYNESLHRSEKVLKRTQRFTVDEVPRRAELEAHLHSYIGNAQLELGELEEALKHHQTDYNIAQQNNLSEAKSRALDNMGRVLVRQRKYREAIKIKKKKVPTATLR